MRIHIPLLAALIMSASVSAHALSPDSFQKTEASIDTQKPALSKQQIKEKKLEKKVSRINKKKLKLQRQKNRIARKENRIMRKERRIDKKISLNRNRQINNTPQTSTPRMR